MFLRFAIGVALVVFSSSCPQNESEALQDYLAALTALEVSSSDIESSAATTRIGTTKQVKNSATIQDGIPVQDSSSDCGDGIVGGLEQCDQDALPTPMCTQVGGVAGVVSCTQDCKLDVSRCLTPEIDVVLGGTAENCNVQCHSSGCDGGCAPLPNDPVRSQCRFSCESKCVGRCEGKFEATVQECTFICSCITVNGAAPACDCIMGECDLVVAIAPNITSLISKSLPRR